MVVGWPENGKTACHRTVGTLSSMRLHSRVVEDENGGWANVSDAIVRPFPLEGRGGTGVPHVRNYYL